MWMIFYWVFRLSIYDVQNKGSVYNRMIIIVATLFQCISVFTEKQLWSHSSLHDVSVDGCTFFLWWYSCWDQTARRKLVSCYLWISNKTNNCKWPQLQMFAECTRHSVENVNDLDGHINRAKYVYRPVHITELGRKCFCLFANARYVHT